MTAHSHGLNGHTHDFTPSGSISEKSLKGSFTYPQVYTVTSGIFSHKNHDSIKTVGDYNRAISTVSMDASHNHTFSGTKDVTSKNYDKTTSVTTQGSFLGSKGTTASIGSATAFSIMPPYVVKYCWERIA